MTRHNLDEHLSWLLHSTCSMPPPANSLPAAPISFTPIEASQRTPDGGRSEDISRVRQGNLGVETQVTPQAVDEMARLRTAPASAGKRNLVSLGPRLPDKTPPNGMRSRGAIQMVGSSRPQAAQRTPYDATRSTIQSPDNVEIMDLTESMSQMGSPTPVRTAGRKRKGSELESDFAPAPLLQHGERTRPGTFQAPRRASQQSFTAIDEIKDEPPHEPPPPYSTIPPRLASPFRRAPAIADASTTISRATLTTSGDRILPDSEDDEEDNIVKFTATRPRGGSNGVNTPASKKRTLTRQKPLISRDSSLSGLDNGAESMYPSLAGHASLREPKIGSPTLMQPHAQPNQPQSQVPSANAGTQDARNDDFTLVERYFAITQESAAALLQAMETRRYGFPEMIADCLDNPENELRLQQEFDELDLKCKAMVELMKKREDYQRLCDEKDQLRAAYVVAIRAREGSESARAATLACKAQMDRLRSESLCLVRSCQQEINKWLATPDGSGDASNLKSVAVQSTQVPTTRTSMTESAIPSSSRIAQTQVVKPDHPVQARHGPRQPRDAQQEISPSNIDAYFSPSKKRHVDKSNDQGRFEYIHDTAFRRGDFNDINDDDMFPADDELFSNRMGTPPAPFDNNDEEEDFGIDDDDEMLEIANDIENFGGAPRAVHHSPSRPVFTERSVNGQAMPGSLSAKKTKKTPINDSAANPEELFHFPWGKDVKQILRGRFRLRGFRENQLQAINATLSGKDAFVLMPTGGGKSLCYQLPSLITTGKTRGVTIVVTPLLSLMEDQVAHLRKNKIQAFLINGETSNDERSALMEALKEYDVQSFVQILYVTPEMLSKSQQMINTFERLHRRQKLARLVIDEAHCVSQWGHDFRPDYKLIGDVRRKFPDVPVIALTATATENVKVDVIHNLGMEGCEVFTQSFNRPNLYYEVRPKRKGGADLQDIASLINEKHRKQTGIIYCLSRNSCEKMAEALRKEHKIKAHWYHAGMKPEEKSETQKKWQAGEYHVIVATIAFGMGIDKADVRFVIHHSIPKSLEGYYQETGRAGRDGKKSGCYLFYGYQDAGKLRRMIDDGEGSWEQKERQHQMLRKMVQFCENQSDCRRVQVLSYFNERFDRDDCENQCDNCNSASTFQTVDFTHYAQQAVSLVRKVAPDKVTLLHCVDVFRGAANKKINDRGHDTLGEYGEGKDLDRGDVQRLFYQLLNEDVLSEDNIVNKTGFAHQYVRLGQNCNQYRPGRGHLQMQIRTTPRAKAKVPSKKKSKKDVGEEQSRNWKKTAGSMAPPEPPLSTNVSSPIQAASSRRKASKPRQAEMHANGYQRDEFVISDPEDDNYAETDEDGFSDGFEPIRVAGQRRREMTRALGPPITSDHIMESLNVTHRMFVDSFIGSAREKAKEIALNKNLRTVPFSDTMLRQMAIDFTETEAQMLRIPGIIPEKVQLYGKYFYKMIRECRLSYEDTMAQTEELPDPNARNVIDLVSDNEVEDEYGSMNGLDMEDEEVEGEPSAYFQPIKDVEEFNARFAQSQSAAMRAAASSQNPMKGQQKGKKQNYKAKGSVGGGSRRRSGGDARHASGSNEYRATSGVLKRRAPPKRSGGSAAPRRAAGGVVSAMPT